MNWTKHKHYIESDNGKYRISKTASRHKTKIVMRYRLWRKGQAWEPMGLFDDAQSAKYQAQQLADDETREEV